MKDEPIGHGQRVAQEPLTAGELQVVDHVDHDQRHRRLVGGVAVQIGIFGGHRDGRSCSIVPIERPRSRRERGYTLYRSNRQSKGAFPCP
jgi:hypothetical protein